MKKSTNQNASQTTIGKVDIIYNTLKQQIISTHYVPGEILNENAIAKEFGVSRTPVREALRRLQQDHWLIVLPNIGMQVETFDVNHFKNLFITKESLETLALRQAIDNITDDDVEILRKLHKEFDAVGSENYDALIALDSEIHRKIWNVANNKMLSVYLEDVHDRLQRTWTHTRKQGIGINKELMSKTFSLIIESIEKRDKELANEAVHKHIEYHRDEIRQGLF